jgi:hypothetical protein
MSSVNASNSNLVFMMLKWRRKSDFDLMSLCEVLVKLEESDVSPNFTDIFWIYTEEVQLFCKIVIEHSVKMMLFITQFAEDLTENCFMLLVFLCINLKWSFFDKLERFCKRVFVAFDGKDVRVQAVRDI